MKFGKLAGLEEIHEIFEILGNPGNLQNPENQRFGVETMKIQDSGLSTKGIRRKRVRFLGNPEFGTLGEILVTLGFSWICVMCA